MSESAPDDATRREVVEGSNHLFGLVLSIVGALLITAALALTLIAAAVATWDPSYKAADMAEDAPMTVGLLVFFGMVFLILGEQMRRGRIMRTDEAPPGSPKSTRSHVSVFRPLATNWRIVWIAVGIAVSAVLLVPLIAGFTTGGWPHDLPGARPVETLWSLSGSFAFAVTVGCINALIKSAVAARRQIEAGRESRTLRWLLYRWRLDTWIAGTGAFFTASFSVFAVSAVSVGAEDTGGGAGAFTAAAAASAIVMAGGMILGAQFWRTGESLGSGESGD